MNLYQGLKILTIVICLNSIIVGIILMVKLKPENKPRDLFQYSIEQNSSSFGNQSKSTTCKIPRTPIWTEFMKKVWKISPNTSDCSERRIVAQLNDTDQMLRVLHRYSNLSCCLSKVSRIENRDSRFKRSKCKNIVDRIVNVSEIEFLVIKCGRSHVNYFANIPMKPKVQSKIDVWKRRTKKSKYLPINVLMIGIDTVSRSHAYRSIPKTMDLLKRIGFHDFQGYHSLSPSTLSNYMGFLMGLKRKSVREDCAPNWKSPFDPCPFIWKNFSVNDYVTMYIEDGKGTFNWWQQSGFHSQPTDYYVHPLFLANKFHPCISSESVPQFMLGYTKRFIQKFKDTPFFSFTWFNDPFHEDMFALQNLENDTLEFFESLTSVPRFLERTLIVFLSDHGERFSYSDSKSGIEVFIERGLPPLFIRFPELLKTRHPELKLDSILEHNVNSLITPFDLHHTFLHILTLDGGNTSEFEPIRLDRQSLLTRIDSENRNCETVNIPEGNCVCNINVNSREDQLVHNQRFIKELKKTMLRELNRIVSSSNYSAVCAKWVLHRDWLSSVRVLDKTMNHSDVHAQFSAGHPKSETLHDIAKFEAKIRVWHIQTHKPGKKKINNFGRFTLIGKISRVSLYGNQSWCVGFDTDEDKEMKQFCLCKSSLKTPN